MKNNISEVVKMKLLDRARRDGWYIAIGCDCYYLMHPFLGEYAGDPFKPHLENWLVFLQDYYRYKKIETIKYCIILIVLILLYIIGKIQ